jgi:uncharacterized protein with PIN domain
MVMAAFRFHEELNHFLPRTRRTVEFSCACARAATTKHMIEALGVPHTEVGQVLVNGEPAGFGRMLQEGDRVEVLPMPAQSPGPMPRFVADAHLGGLARLLRMAGFDTIYDNNIDDAEVESLAECDERIALTRDRDLLKRSGVERGCYVRALKPALQLAEVFHRLSLAGHVRPFTLCLNCNVPLRGVDKALVGDRLPPSVRLAHNEFLTCDHCHGVFWKGSHWRRMCQLLDQIS